MGLRKYCSKENFKVIFYTEQDAPFFMCNYVVFLPRTCLITGEQNYTKSKMTREYADYCIFTHKNYIKNSFRVKFNIFRVPFPILASRLKQERANRHVYL